MSQLTVARGRTLYCDLRHKRPVRASWGGSLGAASPTGPVLNVTGAVNALTLWTRYHRKLSYLQDTGRPHFLTATYLLLTICRRLRLLNTLGRIPKWLRGLWKGRRPGGIFVLCKGRVKLSICAGDGKTLILKIAEPGEVLRLSATVPAQLKN